MASALAAGEPGLVLDLGANDGAHSRLAAEQASYVVAVDGDELVWTAWFGGSGRRVTRTSFPW